MDDLNGQSGAELDTFALSGVVDDIGLTPDSAEKLRAALAPYVEHARQSNAVRLMRVTKLDRAGKRLPSRL